MTHQTDKQSLADNNSKGMLWILLFLLMFQIGLIFPLLSWAGFSPIDEGFQLAYSRRILNGEVPHRDFISIRPVLTPLLHTFDLLFSDNYTFRVSRTVVFVEYALIAYFSMLILARKTKFSLIELAMISVLGMMVLMQSINFSMVWYTKDAMLLSVLGIYLVESENRYMAFTGYFLLGLSPLAKQNFAVVPVSALLMSKRQRKAESVFAIALGPTLYCIVLLSVGAFHDFVIQIGSQSQISYIFKTGCRPTTAVAALCIGMISARLAGKPIFRQIYHQYLMIMIAFIFLTFPLAYGQVSTRKTMITFYFLMGWFIYSGSGKYLKVSASIFVPMILAWTSSITFFHTTVAYFGTWLFGIGIYVITSESNVSQSLRKVFLIVSLIFTGVIFTYVRTNLHTFTFQEPSVFLIDRPLKGVIPGTFGIYTSNKNFNHYRDIAAAAELLKENHLESVVLPDLPSWGVTNKKKNPVAMDWPYFMELGTEQLRRRYADSVIDCKNTHGLIFFEDPFIDESVFHEKATAHNQMWRDIIKEFPNQITLGTVRIYTLQPLNHDKF